MNAGLLRMKKILFLLSFWGVLSLGCAPDEIKKTLDKGLQQTLKAPKSIPIVGDIYTKIVSDETLDKLGLTKILPKKHWDPILAPILWEYIRDAAENNSPIDPETINRRLRTIKFVDQLSNPLTPSTIAICIRNKYKYFKTQGIKSKSVMDLYLQIEVLNSNARPLIPVSDKYIYYSENSEIPEEDLEYYEEPEDPDKEELEGSEDNVENNNEDDQEPEESDNEKLEGSDDNIEKSDVIDAVRDGNDVVRDGNDVVRDGNDVVRDGNDVIKDNNVDVTDNNEDTTDNSDDITDEEREIQDEIEAIKKRNQKKKRDFLVARNKLLTIKWILYHELTHCLLNEGHLVTKKGIMENAYRKGANFLPIWKKSVRDMFSKPFLDDSPPID